MMRLLVYCALLFFPRSSGLCQNHTIGFYTTVEDFGKNRPFHTTSFSLKPRKDKYIPELYKLNPLGKDLLATDFERTCQLAWNGENLFINIGLQRMKRGFVKIEKLGSYVFFIGRPQYYVDWPGSRGWVSQESEPLDTRKSKPYVFDMTLGRIHPLTPSTVERLLEPFPDLLSLYSKDPNWKSLETMGLYIELLNGLLETNSMK
ncbi:MAG: hypothetical protein GC178_02205 [Flavobacteriales bacterium]|nr:hypothetical protein [Flavobacteriales bacterium]